MLGIFITILVACLAYLLVVALGLPSIVGIIAAILILLAGIGGPAYSHRGGR